MKTKLKKTLLYLLFLSQFPSVAFAAGNESIGCGGGFGFFADTLCNLNKSDKVGAGEIVGNQTNRLVSGIMGFLTIVAGLWFGLQLILGGYDWINSAGDKHKLETARNKILYSIIGLIVIVASWVILGLVGELLGVHDLLNPGKLLNDMLNSTP